VQPLVATLAPIDSPIVAPVAPIGPSTVAIVAAIVTGRLGLDLRRGFGL
jgi:hypothetical protein